MSVARAEKSGFAAEAQQKIFSKYDDQLASELLCWIKSLTGSEMETSGDRDNFIEQLKNGQVLCQLANNLKADSIPTKKIHTGKLAFKQMENISFFLSFIEKEAGVLKNELFQTSDLYEGQDPNSVLVALSSLARKTEKAFGIAGLGPKESGKNERNFSEEQLREGQSIIGLQMGSNQGASQAGQNLGNTRHM
jgi:hypothetical protein